MNHSREFRILVKIKFDFKKLILSKYRQIKIYENKNRSSFIENFIN